jgi:muramoyltetrapeptide carboxypeptidase LdcA involved in peptidoglycan recycling
MIEKWNMKDIVGYTDTSVVVSLITEDTFSFVTFNGVRFTMKVEDKEVRCIKKEITK